MKIKTPKLIINHLILKGHRKDYFVPFQPGLNIIYGDSDTGKSSILNLVNYCLGAKKLDLYSEIEIAGSVVLLEIELRGKVYTIRRDIFDTKAEIEVFRSAYEDIEEVFPQYYSPNYSKEGYDGYFSEFLLKNMNIPITKVKQAPSKEDSKMITLSFRDIFKYLYLDQDQVGNKRIFGDNYARLVKLKETFKLMHNVLDSNITELQQAISEKSSTRKEFNKRNISISSFLRETKIGSLKELDEKKRLIQSSIEDHAKIMKEIDEKISADSESFNSFRQNISRIERAIKSNNREKNRLEFEFRNNNLLQGEYANDLKKMAASIEAINKLPKLSLRNTNCPVCEQEMSLEDLSKKFSNNDKEVIKTEYRALNRRKKDLVQIGEKLRDQIKLFSETIEKDKKQVDELRFEFDKQTETIVTPYIGQRDQISSKIGGLESDLKNLQHFYKIRKQQESIELEIITLDEDILILEENLKNLKENAPSLDKTFNSLKNNLASFLSYVGMKNVKNVRISDSTFLPIIRNKSYEDLNSGGVRNLASVGYFLGLMEYAITNPVNYPSFFMVDTIAKYIGKTSDKEMTETNEEEDRKEGMNDADKYENLYRYLLELHSRYSESFQIIIVDNDIPSMLSEELGPFIRKHFSTNPTSNFSQIGLIDDANQ
ncbi:AAA family ATPase [Salegentibacter mishustinae]|uniref:AAA family ATPase n=1 Tax=Salegentibacter mishustinae TaxID=270918 RepID=UPI001CE13931|nr:AAA family ATPase [Salegentibacter mishustinae]UBZ06384.1 AAA family ATPase [Salegentibacter mishustinae]